MFNGSCTLLSIWIGVSRLCNSLVFMFLTLGIFMIHFCVSIIHQQCEGISGTEWARCRHLSVNHPLFIQDSINGSSTSSFFII